MRAAVVGIEGALVLLEAGAVWQRAVAVRIRAVGIRLAAGIAGLRSFVRRLDDVIIRRAYAGRLDKGCPS
jgi:hypothetical protein